MATLKSLIDETTSIKTSITNNRNTLRQILINKNVSGASSENSLSSLISKVNELREYNEGTLFLYRNGDEYTSLTGGLVVADAYGGIANQTLSRLTSFLRFTVSGTKAADMTSNGVVTNNVINCSEYSRLVYRYKITTFENPSYEFDIEYRTNSNKSYGGQKYSSVTQNKPHAVSSGYKEVYVDISNVSRAYIGIWFRIGGYGKLVLEVSEIRLEV